MSESEMYENIVQLELNLKDETDTEVKVCLLQKQIDSMNESLGKVRRKLFAEVGELKKSMLELKMENEHLKNRMNQITNEKTEWNYIKGDYLFELKEA